MESNELDLALGQRIAGAIVFLRGQKVIMDRHLAELYGVETGALNRAVQRNVDRFPRDFMFQVTEKEQEFLRCHFGISKGRGGRRYLPYVFTEQGVAMLSSVLRSKRAILVNVEIMRAFIRLRRFLASHQELAVKLEKLERKYDSQFRVIFNTLRQLMAPSVPNRKKIGFKSDSGRES